MHNSITSDTCEKCCPNHRHRLIHFPYKAVIFSTIATVVTFYKIQQPLHSLNMQPPPTSWLAKSLIHCVRNFKCIFLKSLLLYQLTSCQHFYCGKYWREVPETQGNQRPIVLWCNQPKQSYYLRSVSWHENIGKLDVVQNTAISR